MVLIDFSYLLSAENMDRASLAEAAGDTKIITFLLLLDSEHIIGLDKNLLKKVAVHHIPRRRKTRPDNHKGAAPERAWRAVGAHRQFSRTACG